MIRSVAVKFISFVLAAVFLVCSAASLLGIAVLGFTGLYDCSPEELYQNRLEEQGRYIAENCVRSYTSSALGGCPEAVIQELLGDMDSACMDRFNAVIKDDSGILQTFDGLPEGAYRFEYNLSAWFYSLTPEDGEPACRVTVQEAGEWVDYAVYEYESPVYTVILQISPSYAMGEDWMLLELLYSFRYHLIALAALSLLLFAAFLVCLCCTAGRTPGNRGVRAGGLNRLPLDLYTGILFTVGYLICLVGIELLEELSPGQTVLILGTMIATCLSLLVMAFLFALAAQLKTKGGYWWRNSLVGRFLLLVIRGIGWFFRGLWRLFRLIPVVWRLALIGCAMGLLLFIILPLAMQTNDFLWELGVFLVPLGYLSVLGYLCYAYGTLFQGVRRMKRGELTHKIGTRFLFGSFREFALGLNALSDSARVAAEKQLRSERMKTELITNVSHDIKTPLTSIINYVDLLQKPHSLTEQEQYLEVLSRQSLRLKKLVEDLMEMSKASTGNIAAEITQLDAVEAVNQALGEFSDKLIAAGLTPVINVPDEPVMMLADSRLVWRVLSNLLSNAVKYALPGTRLYVSVRRHERFVVLSIKNVSKEQLGISAEELMERFVRGDASRNTEGSGLGLNIAKSLMELQSGQLRLLVDGDLFKVNLIFPIAGQE